MADQAFKSKVASILEVVDAAAHGDLSRSVDVRGDDAIGQMGQGLDAFFTNLRNSISQIYENADRLSSASGNLAEVSSGMMSDANEASASAVSAASSCAQVQQSVTVVSTGVQEMNASLFEIAKNASEAADVAKQAVNTANHTNATITKLGRAAPKSERSSRSSHLSRSKRTYWHSMQLSKQLGPVNPARLCGGCQRSQGVGEGNGQGTEDISGKVETIQSDTKNAVNAIREISEVINRINEISGCIACAVEEQTKTSDEMARNTSEVARGSETISYCIQAVAHTGERTTEGAVNTQKAAAELEKMSGELKALVAHFTLGNKPRTGSSSSVFPTLVPNTTHRHMIETYQSA